MYLCYVVLSVIFTAHAKLCNEKDKEIRQDALGYKTLTLDVKDTPVTWQAMRGTLDLVVQYSHTTKVTVKSQEQSAFLISVESGSKAQGVTVSPHFLLVLTVSVIVSLFVTAERQRMWWVGPFFILFACGFADTPDCTEQAYIHLIIPSDLIQDICQNDQCCPVLCKLNYLSDYSTLPSNNRLVFSDNLCTIKKPNGWHDWLDSFFGVNSTQDYYGDFDADGLVNILEYYGEDAFTNSFLKPKPTPTHTTVSPHTTTNSDYTTVPPIQTTKDHPMEPTTTSPEYSTETFFNTTDIPSSTTVTAKPNPPPPPTTKVPPHPCARGKRDTSGKPYPSTNPKNADTDGDLLLDGFETSNSMDPVIPNDSSADFDSDDLDNLREQILNTDPMNPDTDGDGVPDGMEIQLGADPRNIADRGRPAPERPEAMVKLTVGDPSPSRSERYILHVGDISHQSPGFGVVGSGTYTFTTGTYEITIQHSGSKLPKLDYHYTASLSKVSGKAEVTIHDPQGILGIHNESSYFYAAGKSATLKVKDDCFGSGSGTDQECLCATLTRCGDCKANDKCIWITDKRICTTKGFWNKPWGTVSGGEPCPCEQCRAWNMKEKTDTRWLTEVNKMFPCPCSVTLNFYSLTPNDQPSSNWNTDGMCIRHGTPGCWYFHPGANGCLRSASQTPSGARQQCCYGDDGKLLAPDLLGAGTPDKSADSLGHTEMDVEPFFWCCKDCTEPNSCQRYIEVRRGDNSHC